MNPRILHLLQQASMLMMMPRTHIRNLGNNTYDTIASHSFHVACIAYCLVRMEGGSQEEAKTALAMGTLHDLAEARTGDADFVAKNYVTHNEAKAVTDQFADIDFGQELIDLIATYEERRSLAAKCAKDADAIAQMFVEWTLMWQGNKLAANWFEADFIHRVPKFRTDSAKQIALELKDSNPQEWWWSEFVEQGVNSQHLNG